MWNKLGLLLLVVLTALAAAVYLQRRDDDEASGPKMELTYERSAENVVLREISPDGSHPMVVKAARVLEDRDRNLSFADFSVLRNGDTFIKGSRAVYDLDSGLLTVRERLSLRRGVDKAAELDGLIWNRKAATGRTDRPFDLKIEGGTIRGDRAEFENDFNDIHFIGSVHARIKTDQLKLGL